LPVSTLHGEIMWVHPDLVENQQWITVINIKSKGKAKVSPCNVVCTSSREAETDVPSLTNSEEETIVLTAVLNIPLVAETCSGQSYLKKYDEMVANPPKSTAELTKQSTKQPMEKKKKIQYAKALPKDKVEGSSALYHFDVLVQLANTHARITFYELLRLSKSTREVLADAEVSVARIPAEPHDEDEKDCLHASQHVPCITFTPGDMQVKRKYDRPLYFIGYIGSSEVSRIQVDSGSAFSIIPCQVMQHLGILTHRLSATKAIIYGFNANGTRLMGKIKLKCQIRDL